MPVQGAVREMSIYRDTKEQMGYIFINFVVTKNKTGVN